MDEQRAAANAKQRRSRRVRALSVGLFAALMASVGAGAQERVSVSAVTPNVLVFATSTGNVVASVGPDGALLVGTPAAGSAGQIQSILSQHTTNPKRYVVIYPEGPEQSQGDAGWGKLGAFVVMQEKALERIGGHKMGMPGPLPERLAKLGIGRPPVSFSEVLSFDINGEAIHIVHQKPGYSDADAVAHFHVANVVYMGEVFPGDGYPRIEASEGGTLEGLIGQLSWTDARFHIVPARGVVMSGPSVKAFADMIITVRDRVREFVKAGKTESEVLGAHPSAEFDAQYGHGRVSADDFVREIYQALTTRK